MPAFPARYVRKCLRLASTERDSQALSRTGQIAEVCITGINLSWQTDGRSAIFHSINLNIRTLIPHDCAFRVPLLRAKEETLWLAKLDRSSHEATANGSSGSTSAATTKPRNAITTTEPSAARCGKRKHN